VLKRSQQASWNQRWAARSARALHSRSGPRRTGRPEVRVRKRSPLGNSAARPVVRPKGCAMVHCHAPASCSLPGLAYGRGPGRRRPPGRAGAGRAALERSTVPSWVHTTTSGLGTQAAGGYGQQSPQAERPRMPSKPSLAMRGTITRAAMGSAHHQPNAALSKSPASRMADR
jgi:hypothetical protein